MQVATPWVEDSVKAELKKLLTEASSVDHDRRKAERPKPTVSAPAAKSNVYTVVYAPARVVLLLYSYDE